MKSFTELLPFDRKSIHLSQTVLIDGIPHSTRRSIGELFEYVNPKDSVAKLIERNLSIENYSTDVILTSVDGKERLVKVYHPIGFLLISMKSDQQKAVDLQIAIAEFVFSFFGQKKLTRKERNDSLKIKRQYLADLAKTRDRAVREQLIDEINTISRELGQPELDDKLLGKAMKQLDVLEDI